jgi:rhodanese-related sulfurtransferase
MRRALVAGLLSAALLAGCGNDAGASTDPDTSSAVPSAVSSALADGAVVIDVRTPSEFTAGHLADALNIDVGSNSFDAKVGALDKGRTYLVYCRSGSRAAQALERMAELGFEDVVNGGAYDDLVAAGVPTG